MFELASRLLPLLEGGRIVVAATGIEILGSSPNGLGTSMVMAADGAVLGSVSGGCVEAAALDGCARILAGGSPSVDRFGFGDLAAFRAGLACGGELDVAFAAVSGDALRAELAAVVEGRAAAIGTITGGPADLIGALVAGENGAGLGGEVAEGLLARIPGLSVARLRAAVVAQAVTGSSGGVEVQCDGRAIRMFVEVSAPAARMVLIGATELAAAVAAAAAAVGYRVTVCDPRPAFAKEHRVPAAVEVVGAWPHEYLATTELDHRSVICLLSHDEELDPLALAVALDRDVVYIGALGSRATHARRLRRLAALGVDEHAARRIHAPIGLDLGASTAAETAVSIVAEVLAVRARATGESLRTGSGPIHRPVRSGGAR
jgi:xanthine dehydrogenase accessory factor